jgi:hypothetical protein
MEEITKPQRKYQKQPEIPVEQSEEIEEVQEQVATKTQSKKGRPKGLSYKKPQMEIPIERIIQVLPKTKLKQLEREYLIENNLVKPKKELSEGQKHALEKLKAGLARYREEKANNKLETKQISKKVVEIKNNEKIQEKKVGLIKENKVLIERPRSQNYQPPNVIQMKANNRKLLKEKAQVVDSSDSDISDSELDIKKVYKKLNKVETKLKAIDEIKSKPVQKVPVAPEPQKQQQPQLSFLQQKILNSFSKR